MDERDTHIQAFDDLVGSYDEVCSSALLSLFGEDRLYFARQRVGFVQDWAERLSLSPRCIVDFGCGTGDTCPLLAASFPGADVVGLDPSAQMIRIAREQIRHERVRFQLPGKQSHLPAADIVYCNGVLHHVPMARRGPVVRSMRRMMRPGSVLFLFENNACNPGSRILMKRLPFDRGATPLFGGDVRRLLARNGFGRLITRFLFFFPSALSFARGLEGALGRLPVGAQFCIIGLLEAPEDA